jgi:Protein of unknown function (DUF3300)
MNCRDRCSTWGVATVASAAFVVGLFIWSLEAKAQEAPEVPTEAAEPLEPAPASDESPDDVEAAFSAEELQALVAPIALYPDLVLVLTLQASLAPLDVVQADRFLAQYAEDPSLEPDSGWDESVIGLLNYPTVVRTMSEDLEWTDTLGTAVITQLEGVQDAIQEFRTFMRAVGALESNEQMTVIAEGDMIRIEPTDEDAVFIPQYDPDALLAALYSTDVDLEPAETGAEAVAELEAETVEDYEAMTESAEMTEGAPAEEAAPMAEAVPAAAPAYYPAVAAPPVTYSDPSPSWLGTAATFAGGAVVGGLVGWAIADDDDDDGDRYSRGNIDIEDSTIVVNRRDSDELEELQRRVQDERQDREALQEAQREQTKLKVQNERLKREAHEKEQRAQTKRELEQRYAGRQPPEGQASRGSERKVAGLATSGSGQPGVATRSSAGERQLAARVDRSREAAKAPPARSAKTVRPGDRGHPQVASAFGGSKSAVQAKRDSDRGLKSRSRAKTEIKPHRTREGGSAFAERGGGGSKAGSGNRGKRSRGGRR